MPLDSAPESPLHLPSDRKKLLKSALEMIEQCRVSSSMRAGYCRQLYSIIETGRNDGARSLVNMLYRHLDRLASHLFSPTGLKFTMEAENDYPETTLKRMSKASTVLTREWERDNTDMLFGMGVFEALRYGAAILKQWPEEVPGDEVDYNSSLVMPWQFGVAREDINDINKQPFFTETVPLDMQGVWRRIYHLPNAEGLFYRIKQHAERGAGRDDTTNFFHQVLSTATLNTGNVGLTRPVPGGIVQLNNDPNYAIIGPEVAIDIVRMHELWVKGPTDYVTIQVIEPDILVTIAKKSNMLISGEEPSRLHPYTLIQPNMAHGYFWGRPEVVDLIEPQGWLSITASDLRRLFGLQIDKILGFAGYDGITDEEYDMRRAAGYFNMPQGAQMQDITPQFPQQGIPMLELIMTLIDRMSGFDNLLSGRGETGVRAGVHAETLLKTASPTLRDRSLLVERQCAQAADLRFNVMKVKDGKNYWLDGTSEATIEATKFNLKDIPDDAHVTVDSHSTSPIFADDHQNLIGFGVKNGMIEGDSAIAMLPFPEKDMLIKRYREKQAEQKKLMDELIKRDPDALVKILTHRAGGHR